jgi:hypothetical protein
MIGFLESPEWLFIQILDFLKFRVKHSAHVLADDLGRLEEPDVDILVFLLLIVFEDQLHTHTVEFFQVAIVHSLVASLLVIEFSLKFLDLKFVVCDLKLEFIEREGVLRKHTRFRCSIGGGKGFAGHFLVMLEHLR